MNLEDMTEEEQRKLAASILGKKGSRSRAEKMSREERVEHGRMMSTARWDRVRAAKAAAEAQEKEDGK